MNLPHIHEENIQANGRANIRQQIPKGVFTSNSQRADARQTQLSAALVCKASGLEEYAALPNPVRVMADFGNAAEVFVELAI